MESTPAGMAVTGLHDNSEMLPPTSAVAVIKNTSRFQTLNCNSRAIVNVDAQPRGLGLPVFEDSNQIGDQRMLSTSYGDLVIKEWIVVVEIENVLVDTSQAVQDVGNSLQEDLGSLSIEGKDVSGFEPE